MVCMDLSEDLCRPEESHRRLFNRIMNSLNFLQLTFRDARVNPSIQGSPRLGGLTVNNCALIELLHQQLTSDLYYV